MRALKIDSTDLSLGELRSKLTRSEKIFAETYLRNGGDATEAYKAAYATNELSHKELYVRAYRLTKKQRVKNYLLKMNCIAAETIGLDTARVIQEIVNIAFANPKDIMDSEGNILPPKEWPHGVAAAVSSLETTETAVGEVVKTNIKVKFWDKNLALDKLMRNIGGYAKDTKQIDHFLHASESIGRTFEWIKEFTGGNQPDPHEESGEDKPVLPALVHLQSEGHGS